MAGDNFGQGWVKNKIVQFVAIYWAVIIVFVEFGKFLERNSGPLSTALWVVGVGLVLFVLVLLSVFLYRRGRRW